MMSIRDAVKAALSLYIFESLKTGEILGKQLPAITLQRIAVEAGVSVEEVGNYKW